ncbi:MAG: response regulator [Actinomycetota bacterium]
MTEAIRPNKILIMEDDLDLAAQWASELRSRDIEPVIAATGAAAIRIFEAEDFDGAIVDMVVNDADGNRRASEGGLILLQRIKASDRIRRRRPIPIVAVSGAARGIYPTILDQARAVGADLGFSKPVQPVELIDGLLRLIDEALEN